MTRITLVVLLSISLTLVYSEAEGSKCLTEDLLIRQLQPETDISNPIPLNVDEESRNISELTGAHHRTRRFIITKKIIGKTFFLKKLTKKALKLSKFKGVIGKAFLPLKVKKAPKIFRKVLPLALAGGAGAAAGFVGGVAAGPMIYRGQPQQFGQPPSFEFERYFVPSFEPPQFNNFGPPPFNFNGPPQRFF